MHNSESSYQSEITSLKNLDELLKCGICYEYMKTTLITPCSHNYCSYCIRKSLMYKTQCPSCFEETTESQLRNNRVLDEVVSIISTIKDSLLKCLTNSPNVRRNIFQNSPVSVQQGTVKHAENSQENRSASPQLQSINHVSEIVPCKVPPSSSNSKTPSTPNKNVRIPSIFSPRKNKVTNVEVVKVSCPVCSVDIPERNINIHLDACLKRIQEKSVTNNGKRKPLPKLVYSLLKEKELRKRLSELGLSSLGDRNTLINRHKRYTLLYNSECDSLNPKAVSEIIRDLKKEEEEEKKVAAQVAPVAKLNVDRKADPKVNEEAQRTYLQEHKSSFQKLIETIQRNKQLKKNEEKGIVQDVDNLEVVSIDETSISSASEAEPDVRPVMKRKHKRILSGSDDSSDERTSVHLVGEKMTVEASVHTPDMKLKVRKKENDRTSIRSAESTYSETSEDVIILTDDLDRVTSNVKKDHKENLVSPRRGECSRPKCSVASPVLGSRVKLNFPPRTNHDREEKTLCESTQDIFEDILPLTKHEEKDVADIKGSDSDVSSVESVSLMVYQGPESLSQCTPTKDVSPSPAIETPSPVTEDSNTPSLNCPFNLGIESIFEDSEDETVPLRRLRNRKREDSRDESNTRTLRKRARK